MSSVTCRAGHAGRPCRRCGYRADGDPHEPPAAPAAPGHCEANPHGDFTGVSKAETFTYYCYGCGESFNHE